MEKEKETVYFMVENDAENAHYFVLRELPSRKALYEDYSLHPVDIKHTEKARTFILTEGNDLHAVVRLFTDEDSLHRVMQAISSIEGHTTETILHVIRSLFNCEYVDVDAKMISL